MKVTIKANQTPAKERKYPCILQWVHDPDVIVLFKEKGTTGIALQHLDTRQVFTQVNIWTHSSSDQWSEFQGTITLKND